MAGGEGRGSYQPPLVGVWWDLNTCPVPADVNPLCVERVIRSELFKQIRFPTIAAIHAIGNLEYISSNLLEKISSCGIILIHAPCGGNNLREFLSEWCYTVKYYPQYPGYGYMMLISGDSTMVDCLQEFSQLSKFRAYPKDVGPESTVDNQGKKVFVKEFVWETLLSANEAPCPFVAPDDEPVFICGVCPSTYGTCKDFITHLKSEQHRKNFASCNYPAYNEFNLSLHNKSEDHNQKLLADKEQPPPQAEDCESRKRDPQVDLVNEINKKQSLDERA